MKGIIVIIFIIINHWGLLVSRGQNINNYSHWDFKQVYIDAFLNDHSDQNDSQFSISLHHQTGL